jgi:hypothetical protein
MIEAVFAFGLVNIIFEMTLLSLIKPRTRLRVLGSEPTCAAMHVGMLALNLFVHWGTIVGTMSSITAFCCSLMTVAFARKVYGFVCEDRYYTVGWIKFSKEELT